MSGKGKARKETSGTGNEDGESDAGVISIMRIQELMNKTLEEIGVLGETVKSNAKAVEINAASIKDSEKSVKNLKTGLNHTNEKVDKVFTRLDTLEERLLVTKKILEASRRVSESSEGVSQKELNDASLLLAMNGVFMTKPAKDLDLRGVSGDRKVVSDALKDALGEETANFILKADADGNFSNIYSLEAPVFQKRFYPERVPLECRNSLMFSIKNRSQLAHFERSIRRRLAATKNERRGKNAEYLDLNIWCPSRGVQLLESVLNAQARLIVGNNENLIGWRLIWRRKNKSSFDMSLYVEVKASMDWMNGEEMRSYVFANGDHQVRAQWTFLRNINTSSLRQSFFPRLRAKGGIEAQGNARITVSEVVTVNEEGDNDARKLPEPEPEKEKKKEKNLGAKRKTSTRS